MKGWLLDLYADAEEGLILWVIGEDGQRHRFIHDFPVTFYIAGPFTPSGASPHLRAVWQFIKKHPVAADLERATRRDLFAGPVEVLVVRVANAALQPRLFHDLLRQFPALDYYDTDIPLTIRYAAAFGAFPLAFCQIIADEAGHIQAIEALDSPWDLDPPLPPLRVLTIAPNVDPQHAPPRQVIIRSRGASNKGQDILQIPLRPFRQLLLSIHANLNRHDPDLIVTRWGDTWLFPRLLEGCQEKGISFFNLNRDRRRQPLQRKENSYFTYGQVVYRGRQFHLFGRWHIDQANAVMYGEYGLPGVLEQARVTGLPVQEMARKSPGAGVTGMQMQTALRLGVMIPYRKQQAEQFKTVSELIRADRGGLVYQPLTGLHYNVAEVDFVSMYPGMMVNFNISPETVGVHSEEGQQIPELDIPVDLSQEGLVPITLRPLLAKRLMIKEQLAKMDPRDCRYQPLKSRAAGLKWLLVVCFGYLGYKNARFGRIEAHEAVTAYSRDVLLSAKEAAEDLGYTVLHMYVDALWVKREMFTTEADVQYLMSEIVARTHTPIALEGIYRWVAFLPSRLDERVPVPNRYFGVFQDGSLKIRGIECNRHDTPPFIAAAQRQALERLAAVPADRPLTSALPEIVGMVHDCLANLRAGRIPPEQLLVTHRVSRQPEAFRVASPAARALAQLKAVGQERRPGQRIQFIHTRGEPGVHAWDLPAPLDPAAVDSGRYAELLARAMDTILRPLGIKKETTRAWLLNNTFQPRLPFMAERKIDPGGLLWPSRGPARPTAQQNASLGGGEEDAPVI